MMERPRHAAWARGETRPSHPGGGSLRPTLTARRARRLMLPDAGGVVRWGASRAPCACAVSLYTTRGADSTTGGADSTHVALRVRQRAPRVVARDWCHTPRADVYATAHMHMCSYARVTLPEARWDQDLCLICALRSALGRMAKAPQLGYYGAGPLRCVSVCVLVSMWRVKSVCTNDAPLSVLFRRVRQFCAARLPCLRRG